MTGRGGDGQADEALEVSLTWTRRPLSSRQSWSPARVFDSKPACEKELNWLEFSKEKKELGTFFFFIAF